jgi:hypothetical protein
MEKKVNIISLDQNAISALVRQEADPFWRDVKDTLIAGVEAGKLLCPVPPETIAETIPCPRETRIKIRDLQTRLSAGLFFKSFGAIEGEETLALVRPGGLRPFPYERGVWHSVEDDALAKAKAVEIEAGKNHMRVRMDAFVPSPGQEKLNVRELRREIIRSRAGDFFRQIERLIHGQPLDPIEYLFLNLCRYLVVHGITRSELEQLREKILTHEWEAIPLLTFHAALSALLDYDSLRAKHPRKYDVNDETDKLRLSTALHCSAMIITEHTMAALVERLENELGQVLEVFALSERMEIKAALNTALAA